MYYKKIASVLSMLIFYSGPALAQRDPTSMEPALRRLDQNGVDLLSGEMARNIPLVQGPDGVRLNASLEIVQPRGAIYDVQSTLTLTQAVGLYLSKSLRPAAHVEFPYPFYGLEANIISPVESGYMGTLEVLNPDGSLYYQTQGPTHVTYFTGSASVPAGYYDSHGGALLDRSSYHSYYLGHKEQEFGSYRFPDGEIWKFFREYSNSTSGSGGARANRLRFITSSSGHGIQITYLSDVSPSSGDNGDWLAPKRVTWYSKSDVYCNEAELIECPAVSVLENAKEFIYNNNLGTVLIKDVNNNHGIELKFRRLGSGWDNRITSLRNTYVDNSTENLSYDYFYHYGSGGTVYYYVSQVEKNGSSINYFLTGTDSEFETSIGQSYIAMHRAIGGSDKDLVTKSNLGASKFREQKDELDRYTYSSGEYNVNSYDRNDKITLPNGANIKVMRDRRANVTLVERKSIDSIDAISEIFVYPEYCLSPAVCNKPAYSIVDGVTTNYTYSSDHGGVTKQIKSPPAPGNARHLILNSYSLYHAYIKNAAGDLVQAASPVWKISSVTECQTPPESSVEACDPLKSPKVTSFEYGQPGSPNTLMLRRSIISADGINLNTCYTYDRFGRKISQTLPNGSIGNCP